MSWSVFRAGKLIRTKTYCNVLILSVKSLDASPIPCSLLILISFYIVKQAIHCEGVQNMQSFPLNSLYNSFNTEVLLIGDFQAGELTEVGFDLTFLGSS